MATDTLTEAVLAELREAVEKIPYPPPWTFSASNPKRKFEAQLWDADGKALMFMGDDREIGGEADAVVKAVSILRNHAPTMLAELTRLRAELKSLGETCMGWARDCQDARREIAAVRDSLRKRMPPVKCVQCSGHVGTCPVCQGSHRIDALAGMTLSEAVEKVVQAERDRSAAIADAEMESHLDGMEGEGDPEFTTSGACAAVSRRIAAAIRNRT